MFKWFLLSLFVVLFSNKSIAQIIDKIIERVSHLQNISYSSIQKEKNFFSDDYQITNVKTLIQIAKEDPLLRSSYNIDDINYQRLYNGFNLISIDKKKQTYTIKKSSTSSNDYFLLNYLTYLRSLIQEGHLENIRDTVINKKHLSRVVINQIANNNIQYDSVVLYVSKENFLPLKILRKSKGRIDGTETVISIDDQIDFSNYKIDQVGFPDLSNQVVPSAYSLEVPSNVVPLKKGSIATDFKIFDTNGNMIHLYKAKGSIILLNFTSNICPHCVESVTMINRLNSKFKKENVQVFSINSYENQEVIKKFIKKYNVNYPIYLGSENLATEYAVNSIPLFYLLDKNGNIFSSYSGYYPELENQILHDIEEIKTN